MSDLLATKSIRASVILYVSSAVMFLFGCLIPLMEMATRSAKPAPGVDSFIELVEWNPYSQVGAVLLGLSVIHFTLGMMTDRRGA